MIPAEEALVLGEEPLGKETGVHLRRPVHDSAHQKRARFDIVVARHPDNLRPMASPVSRHSRGATGHGPVLHLCNMIDAATLLEQALNLPEHERAKIATRLLESLDEVAQSDVDAARVAEIDRRCSAVDAGTLTTSDWKDVRARIEREIPDGDDRCLTRTSRYSNGGRHEKIVHAAPDVSQACAPSGRPQGYSEGGR